MAAIRGVMVDLSGTLHIDNTVIPGSIEALKRYLLYLTSLHFLNCYFRREEQFRTGRNIQYLTVNFSSVAMKSLIS